MEENEKKEEEKKEEEGAGYSDSLEIIELNRQIKALNEKLEKMQEKEKEEDTADHFLEWAKTLPGFRSV